MFKGIIGLDFTDLGEKKKYAVTCDILVLKKRQVCL